jgi:hypothetical protein
MKKTDYDEGRDGIPHRDRVEDGVNSRIANGPDLLKYIIRYRCSRFVVQFSARRGFFAVYWPLP